MILDLNAYITGLDNEATLAMQMEVWVVLVVWVAKQAKNDHILCATIVYIELSYKEKLWVFGNNLQS